MFFSNTKLYLTKHATIYITFDYCIYIIGIFFFITGFHINEWLVYANKPQINAITIMFFILNFLAATQDIVVDGWALTMLKKFVFTFNCYDKYLYNIYVLYLIYIYISYIEGTLVILPCVMVPDKPSEYF